MAIATGVRSGKAIGSRPRVTAVIPPPDEGEWPNGYKHRMDFQIDAGMISASTTDQLIMVRSTLSVLTENDGLDVQFVVGEANVPSMLIKHDAGEVWHRVRIPAVSSTADTAMSMFTGQAGMNNSNPAGVYAGFTLAINGLTGEDMTGQGRDHTPDGVTAGVMEDGQPCGVYDGTDITSRTGATNFVAGLPSVSVYCDLQCDAAADGDTRPVYVQSSATNGTSGTLDTLKLTRLAQSSNDVADCWNFVVRTDDGGVAYAHGVAGSANDEPQIVGGSWAGETPILYVDGLVAPTSASVGRPGTIQKLSDGSHLGALLKGKIAELLIHPTALSSAWWRIDALSKRAPLALWGRTQPYGPSDALPCLAMPVRVGAVAGGGVMPDASATMALRAYPLSGSPGAAPSTPPTGNQAIYQWYNGNGNRAYPAGQISDHATTGYRELDDMLPIQLDFNVTLLGRGQHLAIWTTRLDWSETVRPSEIDLLEVIIDGNNTGAGVLYSMGTHRPGGGGTFISNANIPQASRLQTWHTLKLDWDGDDLVWYIDGIERRREANTKSVWAGVQQCFNVAWEIANSWAGEPLTQVAGGQPSPPTAGTPWPCEAQIRNLSFAGVPVDLGGAGGQTYNRTQYTEAFVANGNTQPALSGWVTAYCFGSNLAVGLAGDLRLYGNSDDGVGCNDAWKGHSDAPGGLGTLTVAQALSNDGYVDPYIIRTTSDGGGGTPGGGESVDIDVLASAIGSGLSIDAVTQGERGTVSIASGKARYTATGTTAGSDFFEFTIEDSTGAQSTGRCDVTIEASGGTIPDPTPPAAELPPQKTLQTFTVTTQDQLDTRVGNADPGDTIIVDMTTCALPSMTRSAPANNPIVLRAKTNQGTRVTGKGVWSASGWRLWGFAFSTPTNTNIVTPPWSTGNDNWIIRCRIRSTWRNSGNRGRTWYCDIMIPNNANNRGIELVSGVNKNMHTYKCYFHDSHNIDTGSPSGVFEEMLQCGFGNDQRLNEKWNVHEECLFENCGNGSRQTETLGIKNARTSVIGCTMLNARYINSRNGPFHEVDRCWIEGTLTGDRTDCGIRLGDRQPRIRNVKLVGNNARIEIKSGTHSYTLTNPNQWPTSAHFNSFEALLYNIDASQAPNGSIVIGADNRALPAIDTVIRGLVGGIEKVSLVKHQGTSASGTWANAAPGEWATPNWPVKLTPADVGLFADL